MKKALLATKIIEYENRYKLLSIGDITGYETSRRMVVNKLDTGDEIFLRIQGTGDIFQIYEFISLDLTPIRKIVMRLKHKETISTRDMFNKYGIKAGAECGWLNE